MPTGYEAVLAIVEQRLTLPTDFMGRTHATRRGHLTPIPRDKAPMAHIVGGDDNPQRGGANCRGRVADFTIAIFTRSDEGSKAADAYLIELYDRLMVAFGPGIVVQPAGIHRETEVADLDAARTDARFTVTYPTAGEWSLEAPT